MKREVILLSMSAGVIVSGSPLILHGSNSTDKLTIQTEQRADVYRTQELSYQSFSDMVKENGVILRNDALSLIFNPAISPQPVDVVTAPSMMPYP